MNIPIDVFTVHVGSVRQTATIITMSKEHLRTGDKDIIRFRFIKNPEYLKLGMKMVFREGRTKAIGTVSKLYPHISAVAQNTRQQRAAKKAQEQNHPIHPANEPQKPSKKRRARNGFVSGGQQHPTTSHLDKKTPPGSAVSGSSASSMTSKPDTPPTMNAPPNNAVAGSASSEVTVAS